MHVMMSPRSVSPPTTDPTRPKASRSCPHSINDATKTRTEWADLRGVLPLGQGPWDGLRRVVVPEPAQVFKLRLPVPTTARGGCGGHGLLLGRWWLVLLLLKEGGAWLARSRSGRRGLGRVLFVCGGIEAPSSKRRRPEIQRPACLFCGAVWVGGGGRGGAPGGCQAEQRCFLRVMEDDTILGSRRASLLCLGEGGGRSERRGESRPAGGEEEEKKRSDEEEEEPAAESISQRRPRLI